MCRAAAQRPTVEELPFYGAAYTVQRRSMKARKGKTGIEHACSAEPSPGQIKVKKKTLQQAEPEEGREKGGKKEKDEGRLSLLVDG